ncbi:hypothetical protein ACNPQK_01595 [Acinetobacter guillouiae]|uniref:hypothetical protein n=1 Tax=Acinetobacter guillouiae TaxID=106649 RepID=UPI003AF7E320
MTDLDKYLPIIQQFFGAPLGNILGTFLVALFIYNYVFKSGIVQHLFTAFNFRSWKIDKDITKFNEIISNDSINQTTKDKFKYRLNVLSLQQYLRTKETDLDRLQYLNSFIDTKKAITKYNRCKKKLIFIPHQQRLALHANYSIRMTKKQAKIINSWTPGLYFLLTLPAMTYMLYIHYRDYSHVPNLEYIAMFPLSLIIYTIWVFFIAFILRYYLERANAIELLNMDRID